MFTYVVILGPFRNEEEASVSAHLARAEADEVGGHAHLYSIDVYTAPNGRHNFAAVLRVRIPRHVALAGLSSFAGTQILLQ